MSKINQNAKHKQENITIMPDMKVMLEVKQSGGVDGIVSRISLGSYVEEVTPDGSILIHQPNYRGYNYPLPRNVPILMYLLTKSRMFSLNVRFVECVRRDKLAFVKLRRCSGIKPDQRRNCYRLQCTFSVTVERIARKKKMTNKKFAEPTKDKSPLQKGGYTIDFSDGGMLLATGDFMEVGEIVSLSFHLDTDEAETVEAEVVRFERTGWAGNSESLEPVSSEESAKPTETSNSEKPAESTETSDFSDSAEPIESTGLAEPLKQEQFRYKMALKFRHKCKNQKDRFYKHIMNQQLEKLRLQAEANKMPQPD